MRCAIFDLDGTLVDSSRDLIDAANATLAEDGMPNLLDPVADAGTAFRGGRALLRLGLARSGRRWGDRDIDGSYPAFLGHYEARIDETSRFYPAARETVERLRTAGWRTGICTNKPARLAEVLMARLGARHLFDSLVGADTLPVRKPDPAPLVEAVARAGGRLIHTALIGDTSTDRETARAAGVASIMVTFGPEGGGVAALAPAGLLHRFEDLPALLDHLFGEALRPAVGAD